VYRRLAERVIAILPIGPEYLAICRYMLSQTRPRTPLWHRQHREDVGLPGVKARCVMTFAALSLAAENSP
jgi:hypothetical protein